MGKLVRCLVLSAVMGGFVVAGGVGVAPAQKKDTKPAPAAKAGTIEVYQDKAGKYRFKIEDAEGKAVAMSTKGYDKAEDAKKALEFVKTTLNTAKVTEVKK